MKSLPHFHCGHATARAEHVLDTLLDFIAKRTIKGFRRERREELEVCQPMMSGRSFDLRHEGRADASPRSTGRTTSDMYANVA